MKLEEAKEAISTHLKDIIEICPHCGSKAHIEALWHESHRLRNGDVEFYVTFRCKPCRKLILKTFYLRQNPYSKSEDLEFKGWKDIYPAVLDELISNEEKEFIDSEILQDYEEALKCKSINANRASCAMFRRALQNSLIKLGADSELELIKQIESLDNLPKDIKDWTHQIRIFGNWGAHPDKDNLKEADGDDVTDTHDFISKFLLYMFIMPEKVKLSRKKRDEKTNTGSTEQPKQ